MNRIDLFLKGLEQAFASTGEIAPWPVHVAIPSIYGGDYEASDLYQKLKKISKETKPLEIIGKLYDDPSVAKALLMDVIPSLKVAKPAIPVKQRIWFVNTILRAIERMQAGDAYCLDGSNRNLDDNEVKKLYNTTPWTWFVNNRQKETLGRSFYRVSASAKSLIWSLFFYGWDDVGYENHGPYKITDNNKSYQLVITDYFNLKPTLLWPAIESFSYQSIRLMVLYLKKAGLKIDMFTHLTNKGRLLNLAQGIYLEANGVPIRVKGTAENLSKEILERVSRQHRVISAMSKEEVIKKYIESRYYAFRRWRWYFNEDWRPPKKVFDRIKKWGIIDIPPGKGPSWNELKKAFDPRTDFVPGKPD